MTTDPANATDCKQMKQMQVEPKTEEEAPEGYWKIEYEHPPFRAIHSVEINKCEKIPIEDKAVDWFLKYMEDEKPSLDTRIRKIQYVEVAYI